MRVCQGCPRPAVLNVERMVLAGHTDTPVLGLEPQCPRCGTEADYTVLGRGWSIGPLRKGVTLLDRVTSHRTDSLKIRAIRLALDVG